MAYCPIVLTGPVLVVVIGGGEVAERKVQGLLQGGASVSVVSPQLTPLLEAMAQQDRIQVVRRGYQPGDLLGARLAIAATNDPVVNAAVADEAAAQGCLVNVVDDPQRCTFYVPAVVRRGEITVGVSTSAGSPALARHLRRRLDELIDPEYEQLAGLLAKARAQLRSSGALDRQAPLPWDGLIDETLALLKAGQTQQASEALARFVREAAPGRIAMGTGEINERAEDASRMGAEPAAELPGCDRRGIRKQ